MPSRDLWFLAPVGVALLALACVGVRVRTGFLLGLVAGEAMFLPTLSWSGIYVGPLPWAALATLEALYVAALGAVLALLQGGNRALEGTSRLRPVAGALAWVVAEYARSTTPFGGFPWARLSFSQADGSLARVAVLLGAPGVTFVVALVGGALAAALAAGLPRLARRRGEGPAPRRRPASLAAASAAASAALLLGAAASVPAPTVTGTADVMAIQGDVPQMGLDFNAQRRAVLDNHARVTGEAAAQVAAGTYRRPDLVLWPENASDIDPLRNADAAAVIASAVATVGAPTVVGAVLDGPGDFVSNASLLYAPGGGVTQRYVKRRPAPFAEYIPYRSFFRNFSDKVDLVVRDFAAGDTVGVFEVPTSSGGTLAASINICFEVAFDDLVRDGVAHGANVITVQTNNATFGLTDESVQQLAISRLRAIEHGRTVVHISNVGVSGIITPDGVVHQRTAHFAPAIMSGTVPMSTDLTPATRLGPWPERVAAVLLSALVVAAGAGRRRARASLGRDPQTPRGVR